MASTPEESSGAVERFFSTPEMVEEVIKRLPLKDMLLLSRVCKTWYHTVFTVPSVRRLLFLDPAQATKGWILFDRYNNDEMGPEPGFLKTVKPPNLGLTFDDNETGKLVLKGKLNPLLFTRITEFPAPIHVANRAWFGENVNPLDRSHRSTYKCSYLEMFITQPPCFRIDFFAASRSHFGMKTPKFFPDGVRYKDILSEWESRRSLGPDADVNAYSRIHDVLFTDEADEKWIADNLDVPGSDDSSSSSGSGGGDGGNDDGDNGDGHDGGGNGGNDDGHHGHGDDSNGGNDGGGSNDHTAGDQDGDNAEHSGDDQDNWTAHQDTNVGLSSAV